MNEILSKYFQRIKIVSIIFLSFPILVFLLTWLKLYLAVIFGPLFVTGIYFLIKALLSTPHQIETKGCRELYPKRVFRIFFSLSVLALAWTYFSGIGGYAFQNSDFHFRNAVLHDLINYKWPVVYEDQTVLTYYLTYWMPAALAGKIFGWAGANFFLFLWTSLGVLLVFCLLLYKTDTYFVWPIFVFIFFSGMDVLGTFRSEIPQIGMHLEWWAGIIQYSSFTTQLFWAFNQALPAWLVTLLLLHESNRRNIIAIYSLCIPFAPIPAFGLSPFVLYLLLKDETKEKIKVSMRDSIKLLKDCFSFQNIIVFAIILTVFGSYFIENNATRESNGFLFDENFVKNITRYAVFCLIEFGVISLFVYTKYKNDKLFYLTVVVLLIIPVYKNGVHNVFCMRASIPAILILSVYSIKYISSQSYKLKYYLFILVLLIGAFTPLSEGARSIGKIIRKKELIADSIKTLSLQSTRNEDISVLFQNFLSKKNPDGFFSQFLQKK